MKKGLNGSKKLLGVAVWMMSMMLFCGCGEENTQDFATYAESIEGIELPQGTRLVALGEASHGNKEFQELKLDVFSHLVENSMVRGLALEADFGGCAVANNYILYDEGTAEEAVKKLGFEIYRTDEMLELVEWMHDYNIEASQEERVRLYGFDMQRDIPAKGIVKQFYEITDKADEKGYRAELDAFYGEEEWAFDEANLGEMKTLLEEIKADLEQNEAAYQELTGEEKYAYALQTVKCLIQNVQLHGQTGNYNNVRDSYMAENVRWILDREENLYGTQLMLAGHNGHLAQVINSSYKNLGSYLQEEFEDAYFVIGTDFYHTTCSIAETVGRKDYEFCSDDPLAKAVGELEENMYYLDFAAAEESTTLSELLNNSMTTGSLGEGYSPMMKVLKSTYQINIAPAKLYDGMIFVYEATPIDVWDYREQ